MTTGAISPSAPRVIATHEFSDFRSAVSNSFVPLQVHSQQPGRFSGRIRIADLDDIHVSEVTAREHWVERTADLIERGDRRYFKLSLQLAGSGLLIQDNREAMMQPGDVAIYDTGRPYSMVFDDDFRMMVVMFPQTLLQLPLDSMGQLTAVRFASSDGLTGMVAPFLAQLANGIDKLSGATGSRLAHSAVDLVSTMYASELGDRIEPSAHRALADRVRTYIERNLGNPELSPASIAAAHYISVRHLHEVFREESTTVSTWIRTRRLDHCRLDLSDPVFADQPIGAIASRWGFIDAAHFSRLYRATFGYSPSETRATAFPTAPAR